MSQLSTKITFVIFTYNEEKRIERAIKNFIKYGKVLVVDNFSTDTTVDIAKEYGCDVLMNKNCGWVEDEITTANVFAAVTTEWIYWAYADELIEHKSLVKILSIVDSDEHDIISVRRKNYYYGKFCHDAFADRLNRVFRVGAIDFSGNKIHYFGKPVVHKNRIFELPCKYHVHHFISNTASSYLKVMDKYTDIQAPRELKHIGSTWLIFRAIKYFVTHYFLNGAFRAGSAGFYLVINMVYYHWLLNMKRYELDQFLENSEIERSNNVYRDRIIMDIERS